MSVLDRPMFGSSETEIAQSVARQEDLLNAVELSQSTSLGPNQFRLGNKIYTIGPDFEEAVKTRQVDGMSLYPIINARDAEFGSNVERILREFVATDEPFRLSETFGEGFESRGSFFQPEDIGSAVQGIGRNVARGVLSLAKPVAKGVLSFGGELFGGQAGKEQAQQFAEYIPEMSTDLEFAQQRAEQLGLKDFSAEIEKIAPSPTPAPEPTPAPKINMGASQFELDEANKAIQEELGEIGSNIEVPSADEEVTTEIKAEGVDLNDKESVDEYVDQQIRKDRANVNYFSSPKFLSFVRNLSSALTSEMQMGSGLAKGASAFAEEQAARDLMREQANMERAAKIEELMLEKSLEASGGLKSSDAAKDAEFNTKAYEAIQGFEKTSNDLSRLQYAIEKIDEGGATGFRGLFGKAFDAIQSFTSQNEGKEFTELSPREQADAILNALRQENIRDLLGESGRTISNLDREIVAEIFGSIKSYTPQASIKAKLQEIEKRFRNSLAQRKNELMTADQYFAGVNRPSVIISNNKDKILNILGITDFSVFNPAPYDPSGQSTSEQAVNIPLRT